jgi:WD40 repeat protein
MRHRIIALCVMLIGAGCAEVTPSPSAITAEVSDTPIALEPSAEAVFPTGESPQITPLPPILLPPDNPYEGIPVDSAALRLGRGAVERAEVSPDDRYLALSSSLGLYVYQMNPFFLQLVWFDPAADGTVAWSPDSHLLAVWQNSGVIQVINVEVRMTNSYPLEAPKSLDGSSVQRLYFTPDGKALLATHGLSSFYMRMWDMTSGEALYTVGVEDGASSGFSDIRWSPDGDRFVLIGKEPVVYDTATGQAALRLEVEETPGEYADTGIHWFEFLPDGTMVGFLELGGLARWDAAGALLYDYAGTEMDAMPYILWGAVMDSNRAIVYGDDTETGAVHVVTFDLASGDVLSNIEQPGFLNADISSDHRLAAFGTGGSEIIVRDVVTGARVWSTEELWPTVWWLSDGQRLLSVAYDNTIHMWDTDTGALRLTIEGHFSESWQADALPLAWSDDGQYLLAQHGYDNRVLWDLKMRRPIFETSQRASDGATFDPGYPQIEDAAYWLDPEINWHADKDLKIDRHRHDYAALRYDDRIEVWHIASQGRLFTLTGSVRNRWYYDWARYEDWLAVRFPDAVEVWDASEGTRLLRVEGHPESFEWSPDGTRLAVALSDGVEIWDVTAQARVMRFEGTIVPNLYYNAPQALGWGRDGQAIAVSLSDRVVILNVPSGQVLYEVQILPVIWRQEYEWSSHGRTLRMVMLKDLYDHPMPAIVDVNTGTILSRLPRNDTQAMGVLISPDGRLVATGSIDGTILIWEIDPP